MGLAYLPTLSPNEPRKKKPRILSIDSWLFNKDPYDILMMVYEIIPTKLGRISSPTYPPVFFHCSNVGKYTFDPTPTQDSSGRKRGYRDSRS